MTSNYDLIVRDAIANEKIICRLRNIKITRNVPSCNCGSENGEQNYFFINLAEAVAAARIVPNSQKLALPSQYQGFQCSLSAWRMAYRFKSLSATNVRR